SRAFQTRPGGELRSRLSRGEINQKARLTSGRNRKCKRRVMGRASACQIGLIDPMGSRTASGDGFRFASLRRRLKRRPAMAAHHPEGAQSLALAMVAASGSPLLLIDG